MHSPPLSLPTKFSKSLSLSSIGASLSLPAMSSSSSCGDGCSGCSPGEKGCSSTDMSVIMSFGDDVPLPATKAPLCDVDPQKDRCRCSM